MYGCMCRSASAQNTRPHFFVLLTLNHIRHAVSAEIGLPKVKVGDARTGLVVVFEVALVLEREWVKVLILHDAPFGVILFVAILRGVGLVIP